jgi:starvation-inducible DNA-binding protein
METIMDKPELIEKLKEILASAFSLYLKAHNYHWNVTGPNFSEYHKFFGKYYENVHDSIDLYAEHIRMLGVYTPGSLKRFSELTKISDEVAIPSAKFMFVRLASDNALLLDELRTAHRIADALGEIGVSATLETQIQFHEKMQWQLTAFSE